MVEKGNVLFFPNVISPCPFAIFKKGSRREKQYLVFASQGNDNNYCSWKIATIDRL